MSAQPGRRVVFQCHYCQSSLIKRTSILQHPYLRDDVYQCSNAMCGAAFTGRSELTALASPTGIPDAPHCDLPETPSFLRLQLQARIKQDQGDAQLDLLDFIESVQPRQTQQTTSV